MKYLLATLLLLTPVLAVSASPTPEQRIADFYQQMQTEHNFTKDELDAWFKGVELNQKIIDNMNRPAEKVLTWQQYRKIFIKQDRIDQGIKFWHKHADILQQAEQERRLRRAKAAADRRRVVETGRQRRRSGWGPPPSRS